MKSFIYPDIELRERSAGSYGIQVLILELSQKFGPDKPFEDEQLFDIITQQSQLVEIRDFFKKYIEGGEALPLEQYPEKVGLKLDRQKNKITIVDELSVARQQLRQHWIGQ